MSLLGRLASWIAPPHPSLYEAERREQQARESATLLRQLRAELQLMRRWRERQDDQGAGSS